MKPFDMCIRHTFLLLGRRLTEQELLTLPEHLSSPRFLVGIVILHL